MSAKIPLIRAGSIMPLISWMQMNGRPVRDRLQSVDLAYAINTGPDLPISPHQAVALLRAESRMEGPDHGARVVSGSSLRDLGTIGQIALGGGTLRQALLRVAKAIPTHVSHEVVSVVSTPSGMVLRELWGLKLDDETRHYVQQYFAALIQALCVIAGARSPVFENVVLTPHPEYGLAHLEPWFGKGLKAADDKTLVLVIPARFGNLALPLEAGSEHRSVSTIETKSLQSDGGFTASVRVLIESMLLSETPTVEHLASAAGLSVRTFQRKLHAEGTSFCRLSASAKPVSEPEGSRLALATDNSPRSRALSADGQARPPDPSCARKIDGSISRSPICHCAPLSPA